MRGDREPREAVQPAPLVSVVLITCRGGPYLAQALAAVEAQTFASWEIVVIDDGSPEHGTIGELVARTRNTTLIRQEQAGISVARNVGFAATRGRYVAFLDDDDVWLPDRLERQVAMLEADPEAVACFSQYEVVDEAGELIGVGHGPDTTPPTLYQLLANERWIWIATLLARRSAIERIGGFHSGLRRAEDRDLIWRLAWEGRILCGSEVAVRGRQHRASLTTDVLATARTSTQVHLLQVWAAEMRGDEAAVRAARAGVRADRRYWSERILDHALGIARAEPARAMHELWDGLRTFPRALPLALLRRQRARLHN